MDTRRIAKALKKKGFEEERDSHHIYYYYKNNGQKTAIRTRISHGANEIGSGLISAMSQQMHLEKQQFTSFVECKLTADIYHQHLLDRTLIQE